MLRAAFSHSPLPMGDLYDGAVTGCSGIGAFHGNVSQMEIPGGGGTSLVIPPKEVLGVSPHWRRLSSHILESAP